MVHLQAPAWAHSTGQPVRPHQPAAVRGLRPAGLERHERRAGRTRLRDPRPPRRRPQGTRRRRRSQRTRSRTLRRKRHGIQSPIWWQRPHATRRQDPAQEPEPAGLRQPRAIPRLLLRRIPSPLPPQQRTTTRHRAEPRPAQMRPKMRQRRPHRHPHGRARRGSKMPGSTDRIAYDTDTHTGEAGTTPRPAARGENRTRTKTPRHSAGTCHEPRISTNPSAA